MNRIAEALRGLIAAQNDKAYRTPEDQDRVTKAREALEEWDRCPGAQVMAMRVDELDGTHPEPVADQRARFIEALQWGCE